MFSSSIITVDDIFIEISPQNERLLRQSTTTTNHLSSSSPDWLEFANNNHHRLKLMVAAGTSSAISSFMGNALDCLRVRWQVMTPSSSGGSCMITLGSHIIQTEGLIDGLWRPGVGANMMGMALSAAIRFGYYETVRDALIHYQQSTTNNNNSDNNNNKHGLHMIFAGLITGSVGYVVTTPFHLIKTMIQAEKGLIGPDGRYVSGSRTGKYPYMTNFRTGLLRLIQRDGIWSLYKGAIPLMSRGALFTAGQMAGYDGLKTTTRKHGIIDDGPLLHLLSSISASFGASFLSAPADLVMSKYMAAASSSRSSSSSRQNLYKCIKEVYQTNGITGFWRGWSLFFIRLTPVMFMYSTIYEQIRFRLGMGYLT